MSHTRQDANTQDEATNIAFPAWTGGLLDPRAGMGVVGKVPPLPRVGQPPSASWALALLPRMHDKEQDADGRAWRRYSSLMYRQKPKIFRHYSQGLNLIKAKWNICIYSYIYYQLQLGLCPLAVLHKQWTIRKQ
jgi:hypothetical protein